MESVGTLYFLAGKMGAGKSTFANSLATQNKLVLISEDEWLAELYPNEINTFDDYIPRHNRLLTIIKPLVHNILTSGSSVILDFPANTIHARKELLTIVNETGADHQLFYLNTNDDTCLTRIAKRGKERPERAKFDNKEVFELVSAYFQAPTEDEGLNIKIVE